MSHHPAYRNIFTRQARTHIITENTQDAQNHMTNIALRLSSERNGISFLECLKECASNRELISNYDRLRGTNLSLKGTPIELSIDMASGRIEKEMHDFIDFCWEYVFLRF